MERESTPYYRWFDHTADLGMEIFGQDPAELFANAGRALADALVSLEGHPWRKKKRQTVSIEGYDWADLMINWLRELLYMWHGRQQIPTWIQVNSISETSLSADVSTCDYLPAEHRTRKEIKAVTYHGLTVEPQEDGQWRARVVFDV